MVNWNVPENLPRFSKENAGISDLLFIYQRYKNVMEIGYYSFYQRTFLDSEGRGIIPTYWSYIPEGKIEEIICSKPRKKAFEYARKMGAISVTAYGDYKNKNIIFDFGNNKDYIVYLGEGTTPILFHPPEDNG